MSLSCLHCSHFLVHACTSCTRPDHSHHLLPFTIRLALHLHPFTFIFSAKSGRCSLLISFLAFIFFSSFIILQYISVRPSFGNNNIYSMFNNLFNFSLQSLKNKEITCSLYCNVQFRFHLHLFLYSQESDLLDLLCLLYHLTTRSDRHPFSNLKLSALVSPHHLATHLEWHK